MNKQFIIKMLQAKQLEYEALKEIMPDKMILHLDNIKNEILDIGKEYIMTAVCNSSDKDQNTGAKSKSGIKKVTIE